MDTVTLRGYLDKADRHCAEGEMRLTRQRLLADRLRVETRAAEHLLEKFEQMQATHLAQREHMRSERDTSRPITTIP